RLVTVASITGRERRPDSRARPRDSAIESVAVEDSARHPGPDRCGIRHPTTPVKEMAAPVKKQASAAPRGTCKPPFGARVACHWGEAGDEPEPDASEYWEAGPRGKVGESSRASAARGGRHPGDDRADDRRPRAAPAVPAREQGGGRRSRQGSRPRGPRG